MIRILNEGTEFTPPRRLLEYWSKKTLRAFGGMGEADISIIFVSKERIQALYSRYAAQNKPTTVLTFPWQECEFPGINERRYLGEILIAPNVVVNTYGSGTKIFRSVLRRITVHAILHLLGFDHGTPAARLNMEQAEQRVLDDDFEFS